MGARKEKIATISAQVAGWANSRTGCGLTQMRAQKSARMTMPKIMSSYSIHGSRGVNEVPTMNRMVRMSKASSP